jgi:alkylhydroperoxidase family enzyme
MALDFTDKATPATLAALLQRDAVSWETLEDRYRPLLELVRTLLGVVPNCDRYLEIWEPGFRTYNIMVPNFLNLPFSIFGVGGAPADVVGLGMYVTSRTAECSYCSAHACSFAIRRGASPDKVARALLPDASSFTTGELATVAVARALGRIPCELTPEERDQLVAAYGADRAEWIVLGIVMMGFLNKFMNAIGVELEQQVVSEVATTLGDDWTPGNAGADLDPTAVPTPLPPTDSITTKLRIVPLLPAALRQDRQWQRGVPATWPEVGAYLQGRVGHDFPVLGKLRHKRAVKSVASMLRDNLDPATTVIGLDQKVMAGLVFAELVNDDLLAQDVRALATRQGLGPDDLAHIARFARTGDQPPPDHPASTSVLLLARAISPSPVDVDDQVVSHVRTAGLSSQAIVELVTWIAVLQMLHRLTCFYDQR